MCYRYNLHVPHTYPGTFTFYNLQPFVVRLHTVLCTVGCGIVNSFSTVGSYSYSYSYYLMPYRVLYSLYLL